MNNPIAKTWPNAPQVILTGILKEKENSDIIVFTLPLNLFEIVFIVTVPSENAKIGPVYAKFRLQNSNGDWTEDPQVVLTGVLKEKENSDIIIFNLPLSLFDIVCIVTIPQEGSKSAPVYVKFIVRK